MCDTQKKKLLVKKNIVTSYSKRGYTILKNKITDNILKEIRSDLCVQPFVNKDYGGSSNPFNIYLESNNKLYLPKFLNCIFNASCFQLCF